MKPPRHITLTTVLVLTTIVVVLGLAVAGMTWWLRADLREQILNREGEALYAVTVMQQTLSADQTDEATFAGDEDQLVILALQISRLRGVLGVQVFDRQGQELHTMPTSLQLTSLQANEWLALRALQPVVNFRPAASLGGLYGLDDDPDDRTPLLEITVPLHQTDTKNIEGVARYVIEGQVIAREFNQLDRGLLRQAGLVWLLASVVLVAGVGGMLQRLANTHAVLLARTQDLAKANCELSLAAKTSALGAITAHLVHGLKNPIAGLEAFLEEQRQAEPSPPNGAWSEANATTRRMSAMVSEVIDLLQEEHSGSVYELSGREILATVADRIAAMTKSKRVSVIVEADNQSQLTNHQAGLATAILVNLAQNACEALPAENGQLSLSATRLPNGSIQFQVSDNGPGLTPEIKDNLFAPKQSRKPGGAGIGLAISRQLALHLGGTLTLVAEASPGTSFQLVIPKPE